MQERYPTLLGISNILRVVGYVAIAGGLFGGLWALTRIVDEEMGAAALLLPSGWALTMGITWLALGELISVFIDIEANTRRMDERLGGHEVADRRGEAADSVQYVSPSSCSEPNPQRSNSAHSGSAHTTDNVRHPQSADDIPQHLAADELLANARRLRSGPGLKAKISAHYFYEAFLDRYPTNGAVYQAKREMEEVDEQLDRMKVDY